MTIDGGPVVGEDGLARCPWAAGDPLDARLSRHRVGHAGPAARRAVFERITLEAFQTGLSWLTILRKRPGFRDGVRTASMRTSIAGYTDDDVARLMADAGIVRNRAKILATLQNARATVGCARSRRARAAHRRHTGWTTTTPPDASPTSQGQTPRSHAHSRRTFDGHGFVFVGPTTAWALMQAIGLVDDHLVGCHRRGARGSVSRP